MQTNAQKWILFIFLARTFMSGVQNPGHISRAVTPDIDPPALPSGLTLSSDHQSRVETLWKKTWQHSQRPNGVTVRTRPEKRSETARSFWEKSKMAWRQAVFLNARSQLARMTADDAEQNPQEALRLQSMRNYLGSGNRHPQTEQHINGQIKELANDVYDEAMIESGLAATAFECQAHKPGTFLDDQFQDVLHAFSLNFTYKEPFTAMVADNKPIVLVNKDHLLESIENNLHAYQRAEPAFGAATSHEIFEELLSPDNEIDLANSRHLVGLMIGLPAEDVNKSSDAEEVLNTLGLDREDQSAVDVDQLIIRHGEEVELLDEEKEANVRSYFAPESQDVARKVDLIRKYLNDGAFVSAQALNVPQTAIRPVLAQNYVWSADMDAALDHFAARIDVQHDVMRATADCSGKLDMTAAVLSQIFDLDHPIPGSPAARYPQMAAQSRSATHEGAGG